MKSGFKKKMTAKILCMCLALSLMLSACGSTNGTTPSTEGEAVGAAEMGTQEVSINKADVETVSAPGTEEAEEAVADETVTEEAVVEEETKEPERTEEEKAWKDNVMAKVEGALNVRVEPKQDAELAGKLQQGDLATVVEKGDTWTKIKSGNLEGYVNNEYCVFGVDALAYAKENCKIYATASGEGLRVREAMDTESKILKRLSKGEKLVVDKEAKVESGWVAVKCDGKTGYVSAEFVTLGFNFGKGLTMDEIREIKRQEEEAKKKEEAEKNGGGNNGGGSNGGNGGNKKPSNNNGDGDKDGSSKPVNTDDATLLAALVYCEAGAEPYAAQLGVASVVVNRMKHRYFPNTIKGVIYQKSQFGPASSGKLARRLASGKVSASCMKAAKQALSGVDNTNGALYFKLAKSGKKGVVHGRIVFY